MNAFIERVKFVKIKDVFAFLLFVVALPIGVVLRCYRPHIWLICEEKQEARDNGYFFFKYLRDNHKEVDAVYAIDKKSPDAYKVLDIGHTISYGTLIHWIYYIAAEYNISSQKGGKPNAAVCFVLEVFGIWKNKRVFLQHGVTINNVEWLYYDVSKIDRFICSTRPEYEFIKENFGYPKENIILAGFSRWDDLHDYKVKKNRILIMPTWREWLGRISSDTRKIEAGNTFIDTLYYKKWSEFINSEKLAKLSRRYDLEIIFFPHRNMQKYLKSFTVENKHVKIASWKEYDVHDLLKTSEMIITDYSSVFFDMVYMKKPVIFYQFDLQDFRKHHYKSGYFDYTNNPFGKSYTETESVLGELERIVKSEFLPSEDYIKGHRTIFPFYDANNSERIYEMMQSWSDK